MDAFAKGTAVAILIVIILFAVLAAWYLNANNFARETLEVVFPAFGAILLSLYLGYKTVAIDRPPPKRFGTTVAILHDAAQGTVSGMAPMSLRHLPRIGEFDGVRLIDTIPRYTNFKTIPIVEQLRDTRNTPQSPADEMITNILEFALCEWLAKPENAPGFLPARTIQLISGGGGGGGALSKDLQPVRIGSTDNPLVVAQPVSLLLPPHSRARAESRPVRALLIETRHSDVAVRILSRVWNPVNEPIGADAERIYAALNLPRNPQGLEIHGFELEVIANQRPFTRFSTQAKVEAEWLARLERNLDAAFSWERLRSLYTRE